MLQRSPRSHVEGGERRCALGVGFVDGTLAFVVNTIVFDAVSTQNIYVSAGHRVVTARAGWEAAYLTLVSV